MQPFVSPGRHGAARVSSRDGLTLIELVVVIAILSAIAGLVTSFFTGMVQRSSVVVGSASAMDLIRALERHRTRSGGFPDGYDSLIEAPYTLYSAIPAAARRQLKPKDLDNADRVVLHSYGITTTWMHAAPDGQAVTWQPLSNTKALDVTAGGFAADDVAALDTSRINPDVLFGRGTRRGTVNESFVVLGIGDRCSLVGADRELSRAPTTPGASASLDPHDHYMRYAFVFRLDRDDRRPLQFLGTIAFAESGIVTGNDLMQQWWKK